MTAVRREVGDVIDHVSRRGEDAQDQEAERQHGDLRHIVERVADEQGHEQQGVLRPLVRAQRPQHRP
jgi:hypothetical protein